MVGNALALAFGVSLAVIVRRTNYSIPAAFSEYFMMGRRYQLGGVLLSVGIFSLVNIWGYEPCPT